MLNCYRFSCRTGPMLLALLLFIALARPVSAAELSISGSPPTAISVGERYSFHPDVSGTEGEQAYFRVRNKPSWLEFDSRTGALEGTPSGSDVATYSEIRISVWSNGQRDRLPRFTITVEPSATDPSAPESPDNGAPIVSGSPIVEGSVGDPYSFTPQARDPDGDPLTFSIQNKPSWANFDSATGTLSGTPAAAGSYAGIVITASDGTTSTALAPFELVISTASQGSGSAIVTWKAPTANVDGTPLRDLAGFKVVYGTAPDSLRNTVDLPAPTFTSAEIVDLSPGTYYFAVRAYTVSGAQSEDSQVVTKTLN